MRLFISINLDTVDELRAAQAPFEALSGIRTLDPEQVHFTLKFIGELDKQQLPALQTALSEAVADAGVQPFDVAVGGYGAFPDHDYITVIWVGVRDGGHQFHRLHDAIERRTVDLGVEPADHSFTPHATIARMDHADEKARVQTILEERDPDVGSIHVSTVELMESRRTPSGSEYRTIHTVEL
ncbi:RNA 2',3'-cyclic phosphodiesterase [Halocatena pleomorpha]|uniref:RNA 2',3'-cyclic phosphodiesterase n=1 Tax=Halocatena pleomorpha TaxID=1785090 RepID=A0A3P3RC19_9EURY|nr:RNA 2',3'-cyclic phosphodiesterase [Halocatena pleomorpha]RRJ31022.1 RNA 2',3'-cyclic phosphodiesterase [Halocatena pleomorpha]